MKMNKFKKKRIIAAITDVMFMLLLDTAIVATIILKGYALWLAFPVSFAVHLIYCTAFSISPMRATPGLKIQGLQICNMEQHQTVPIGKLFLRPLFSFFSCLIFGFGFWYFLIDSNGCTIYDYASRTIVQSKNQKNREHNQSCLIGVGKNSNIKYFFSDKECLLIGRNPVSCQIVLPADEPCVSRIHCQVRYNHQTDTLLLKDMGSSYGTFLKGGIRLQPEQVAVLEPGQEFYVGTTQNMFAFFASVGGKQDA